MDEVSKRFRGKWIPVRVKKGPLTKRHKLRADPIRREAPLEQRKPSLEERQLVLEERKVALEERKSEVDSELRRREAILKEKESARSTLTVNQATVFGAILTLIGGMIGAYITTRSTENVETGKSLTSVQIQELKVKGDLELEQSKQRATEALERKKFETSLILEAIKTPSRSDAIRNLKFFVTAGFVSDPDKKIANLKDENLPSIGVPSPKSASRAIQSTGALLTKTKTGPAVGCTAVAVSNRLIVTAKVCVGIDGSPVESATFTAQGQTYYVHPLDVAAASKFALLAVEPSTQLVSFLDRSRIRDPLIGEPIYFAVETPGSEVVALRTCQILSLGPDDEFRHDCQSGMGSAGAVIIAVSDDALLGIHYGTDQDPNQQGPKYGKASKLPAILASLGEQNEAGKK